MTRVKNVTKIIITLKRKNKHNKLQVVNRGRCPNTTQNSEQQHPIPDTNPR